MRQVLTEGTQSASGSTGKIVNAFLLLTPRTSGLGALMLAGVMVGAVVTHVFIVGGAARVRHLFECGRIMTA